MVFKNSKIILAVALLILISVLSLKVKIASGRQGGGISSLTSGSYYINVLVTDTEKPGGGSFSLPIGSQMTILEGAAIIGGPYPLTSVIGEGGTFTSGLVNITTGTAYTVRLTVPLCYSGIIESNMCWYKVEEGMSCNNTCLAYNTAPATSAGCSLPTSRCCNWPAANAIFSALSLSCDDYYPEEPPYHYSVGGNYCYTGGDPTANDYCDQVSSADTTYLCACQYDTGAFEFPFTP